jgi:penicillin-binding protein 1A
VSDDSNIVQLHGRQRGGAASAPPAAPPPSTLEPEPAERPPGRPRVKKIRLALILIGLSFLAALSLIFGMLMAVASDLPDLENRQIYNGARNSVIVDANGKRIGLITGRQNQVLVPYGQISPAMRNAIVAIEDRRFYENRGIDIRGIGRALYQDVLNKQTVQGGSTIAQQFVKNALQAQQKRTIFQKLREAALAYHLTRKWSKRKILTEYLNSIYFGNGAYGIESAARTYFGTVGGQKVCGTPAVPYCAARLTPAQAALIAGVVASPAAYDPATNPTAAKARRDLVLRDLLKQGYITRAIYNQSVSESLPPKSDIQPPREDSAAPYFTTWVKQQVVDRFGAQRAFAGGLRIKTTLDLDLQKAAQDAVTQTLSGVGPNAALVAIDNRTGGVAAMVGGMGDYNSQPFNLATQGQRQPGSSFKPFVLAQALKEGTSPDSVWESKQKVFRTKGGKSYFVVNNYNDEYNGTVSLRDATAESDNSVYAEMGLKAGPRRIARLARKMGIRTRVSSNPAVTLGGLRQGVTPLDMAHAYQTLARRGLRIWGSLGAGKKGPVGVLSVRDKGGKVIASNTEKESRVLPQSVATTETQMLENVIQSGTGTEAQLGDGTFEAGKTGTTENYGDAWFVGYNEFYTVAVWVGYSKGLKPMLTEYGGSPVAGGTYPAQIWRQFMESAMGILDGRGILTKLNTDKPDRLLPNGLAASQYTFDTGTDDSTGTDSSGDSGTYSSDETSTDSSGDTSTDSSGDTSTDSSGDTSTDSSGDTSTDSSSGGSDSGQ